MPYRSWRPQFEDEHVREVIPRARPEEGTELPGPNQEKGPGSSPRMRFGLGRAYQGAQGEGMVRQAALTDIWQEGPFDTPLVDIQKYPLTLNIST